MMAMGREPIPLSRITLADIPLVGSKAGRLGDLLRAGFVVPEGYVLPKTMLEAVLSAVGGLPADEIRVVALPVHVEAAIGWIAERFAADPVAVRSTGVAEDLAGSSFAGQYDTVLDVRGKGAIADAVRSCWASAFSARVIGYQKANNGVLRSHEMAVLVQRLIEADAAGVAFSANPVSGDRREILVSAVSGLGDKLVSGEVTPEDWVFGGGGLRSGPGTERVIGPEVASEVAMLAGQVSRHYDDVPHDIEWAVKDGQVWLLQARPITALPEPARALPASRRGR
jgi:pyruvate,water dikinase